MARYQTIDQQGRKVLKEAIYESRGSQDAFQIVQTNANGKIDNSFYDVNEECLTVVAGENLNAGNLVYTYEEGGVTKAKKAIATSFTTCCVGYVKDNVTTGQNVKVYTDGYINTSNLDLSIRLVFLSATTAGQFTQTPPSSNGTYRQVIGFALAPDTIVFTLNEPELIEG